MRTQRSGTEAPFEYADQVGSERHATASHGEDRKAWLLERARKHASPSADDGRIECAALGIEYATNAEGRKERLMERAHQQLGMSPGRRTAAVSDARRQMRTHVVLLQGELNAERNRVQQNLLDHVAALEGEVNATWDGERWCLVGYAAPFNEPTTIRKRGEPGFLEEFAPSAFSYSLRERNVLALVGHDAGQRVGSTEGGELKLWLDRTGLRFRLEPTGPHAAALLDAARAGRVTGVSVGIRPVAVTQRRDRNGNKIQRVVGAMLEEVSFVLAPNRPAYKSTTVGAARVAA